MPHDRSLGWPFITSLNFALLGEEQVLQEDEHEVLGCRCSRGNFVGKDLFLNVQQVDRGEEAEDGRCVCLARGGCDDLGSLSGIASDLNAHFKLSMTTDMITERSASLLIHTGCPTHKPTPVCSRFPEQLLRQRRIP